MSDAVQLFLEAFEANNNKGDMDALVAQFADVFLFAGPDGSQAVQGVDFAKALPKRKELFASLGCRSTKLMAVTQMKLGQRYVLASTQWEMMFHKDAGDQERVTVASTFILDANQPALKVVLYLAHQNVLSNRDRPGTAQAAASKVFS